MWKLALLSLAAVLSAVQGYYNNGLGVSSWDRMLAELMQGRNIQTGTCENDLCYVKIGVGVEDRVLKRGEAFFPDRSTDPCLQYVCESSGVKQRRIKCKPEPCNNGAPVRYPRTCCPQCVGSPTRAVEFAEWGEWTECSRTCGGGKRARERVCIIPDGQDRVACTGDLRQVEDCNNDPCPVNCKWEWGTFGQCSRTCGGGKRSRFPIIRQPAEHGGRPCPPFVKNRQPETEDCNTNPCPMNCKWEWGPFGQCSKPCGGGKRSRFPIIRQPAKHGGTCPPFVKNRQPEAEDCNTNPCPMNCKWEWGPFGQCSKPCGGGKRSRFPIIRQPAKHGGTCPPFVKNRQPETEDCNTNPCPMNCKWEWGLFGQCSKPCGGGKRSRFPIIRQPAKHGGTCPPFVKNRQPETEDCNTNPCPMNCKWEWGLFGQCSKSCGGGKRSRFPIIRQPAKHGGTCPPFVKNRQPETEDCNTNPCPKPLCPDGQHWCDGVCIPDVDKDCVADNEDNCKYKYNPKQKDEEEGVGDGVGEACDNCKYAVNPEQENTDGDATGDACDEDDDNDGVVDGQDNCPLVYNPDQGSKDPLRYGAKCCPPKGCSAMRMDNDDMPTGSDEKGLVADIVEKLLEMYYSK